VDNIQQLQSVLEQMFPKMLGMRLTEATTDRIRAELTVTPDICTTGDSIHGGALMTMADFLGAAGTFLNLPPGAGTTTLESKTNFVSGARVGQTVIATCEPVHKGKRTQVWRTTIAREDGATVAIVTQTQMVLEGDPDPQTLIAKLFTGKSLEDQKKLLAQLERGGATIYRAFAAQEKDPAARETLLKAAEREEENAVVLEDQTGTTSPGP